MHTHNARTQAHKHARTHARTNARMHARTHARMLARTHAQTHTRTHARMHTRRRLRMRAAHLCSGLFTPMLSFDSAVQDCGEVSLSLSVSEPKSAADTFLLDMVVRDTTFSPILMPFQNPRICGAMQTRFFRGRERDRLKLKSIWPSGPARGCYSLGRRFESVCRPSHV